MAPPTHLAPHPVEPAVDLDLDLRDTPSAPPVPGVVDRSGRLRPAGPRRSSRHTHTRLIAALARIHAEGAAERDPERRTASR